MTAVALAPFVQLETNGGLPLAGGKVFAYQAGTLIPKNTFTDRGAGTPNANPVILDSAGRADIWLTVNEPYKLIVQDSAGNVIDSVDDFYAGADPAQLTAAGIVPATGGTYTGLVSFTGGATFDGTPAQDLATLDSLGISAVRNTNLFQNSDFRAAIAIAGSFADGAGMFAGTVAICTSGSVTLSQLGQPQDGIPYASRTLQPDAVAKRMGFVQQVPAGQTYFYRGQALSIAAKVRCSVSTTIRVALVAWTGTADTAPLDVVNNWASTTYTAGNFFIANTSTIAVTATAVTAGTFTTIFASSASAGAVVAPSNMNNLYMVVWTDLPVAQNVTLDASCIECGPGNQEQRWTPNDNANVGRLIHVSLYSATGPYAPTPGTTFVIAEMVGGGGGGAGSPPTGAGQVSLGGGGGGGSYAKGRFPVNLIGGGLTITVGSPGLGGGISTAGGNGTASSFGALMTAPGGTGGPTGVAGAITGTSGGAGGVIGIGGNILQTPGETPPTVIARFSDGAVTGVKGGSSHFGFGPPSPFTSTNAGGVAPAATSWGAGGSGPATYASQGGTTGGDGRQGYVIVHEYA